MSQPLRGIPPVHELLADARWGSLPREQVREAIREELGRARDLLRRGGRAPTREELLASIDQHLSMRRAPRVRRVINATGVVLHTNLGRAPMAARAADAARDAAAGYLNLEMDLASGRRSSRQDPVRQALCELLGCESATAVNNCAAATVLTLRALAQGREVIVSRGQLIEIGGSFRIPEIMEASGAILREVGTTNITRLRDYERAVTPRTALIMRIHPSNYRVRGFAETPGLPELVGLGRGHEIPVVDDVGSGALAELPAWAAGDEPLVPESLRQGADLVLFSGDKLLGGPQAGIVLGRRDLVERLEADPLMRALRLDKMALAALEATLHLYRDRVQGEQLPVLRMIRLTPAELRPRCERVAREIESRCVDASVSVDASEAYVGGGSLPDQAVATVVVALRSPRVSEAELATRLRLGTPAVLPRVQQGRVLLDLRAVFEEQEEELVQAVERALSAPSAAAADA